MAKIVAHNLACDKSVVQLNGGSFFSVSFLRRCVMRRFVVISCLATSMLVALIVGAISVRYVFAASCTQGCGSPTGACDGTDTECPGCANDTQLSCGSARSFTNNTIRNSTSGSNPITSVDVDCFTNYTCYASIIVSDARCAVVFVDCYQDLHFLGMTCYECSTGAGTVIDAPTCSLLTCCEE